VWKGEGTVTGVEKKSLLLREKQKKGCKKDIKGNGAGSALAIFSKTIKRSSKKPVRRKGAGEVGPKSRHNWDLLNRRAEKIPTPCKRERRLNKMG